MKKTNLLLILSFLLLIPCLSACQTELPIDEMAEAHKAIRIAKALKADKYAPELFQKAEDSLQDSHTACKENKIDDAKKSAITAKDAAEEASKISWPLLAADTLKNAKYMYNEAENLDAERIAPVQMNSAAEKIKKAESLNTEPSYNLSYVESLSAMRDIEAAKSLSLTKSEVLLSQITALRKETANIKNDTDAAPLLSDIAWVENLLNSAENNLNEKNIEAASTQVTEAERKINELKTALLGIKENAFASNQNIQPKQEEPEPVQIKDDKPADKVKKTDEKTKFYTVKYIPQERDCLWKISQKVYQDASLWPRIYIANRDQIKDPDLIFPGQRLIIPDISDAVKKAKAKRTARITQKNTKQKSEVINKTKSKETSKTSGVSGNKPRTSDNTNKNRPDTNKNKSDNTNKNESQTDKTKITDKGGKTGGETISGTSSKGTTTGKENFLPEGIFRENQ